MLSLNFLTTIASVLILTISASDIGSNSGSIDLDDSVNILNAFCYPPDAGPKITYSDCKKAYDVWLSTHDPLVAPDSYNLTHSSPPDPSLPHPLVLPWIHEEGSCRLRIDYSDIVPQDTQDGGAGGGPLALLTDLVAYCEEKGRFEGGWWRKPNKRGKEATFRWEVEIKLAGSQEAVVPQELAATVV